jgi:hypothetical protein
MEEISQKVIQHKELDPSVEISQKVIQHKELDPSVVSAPKKRGRPRKVSLIKDHPIIPPIEQNAIRKTVDAKVIEAKRIT